MCAPLLCLLAYRYGEVTESWARLQSLLIRKAMIVQKRVRLQQEQQTSADGKHSAEMDWTHEMAYTTSSGLHITVKFTHSRHPFVLFVVVPCLHALGRNGDGKHSAEMDWTHEMAYTISSGLHITVKSTHSRHPFVLFVLRCSLAFLYAYTGKQAYRREAQRRDGLDTVRHSTSR